MATDEEFAVLAERVSRDDAPEGRRSDAAHGSAARDRGRDLMLGEFGGDAKLDTMLRRAGRRRLGEQAKGGSPSVRGRLPEAEFAAFKLLEERTGKNQSELVREAVHLLLEHHKLSA